ncbi:MAG TPA: hypothetical protein VGZ47_00315 [Gemmataceae bacterium]|jgi:hypothetical protein|nr:hypothetical protein [Gemmataceae bacterium]
MKQFQELLAGLRSRPGMYIGKPSVTRLAFFLRGYDHAMWQMGQAKTDLLAGFRDWIQKRYNSTKHSWEELILRESSNEEDAFRRFWTLWDEYQKESKVVKRPPEVPQVSEGVRKTGTTG